LDATTEQLLIEFTVPGPPAPKKRARRSLYGSHYTPHETREAEERVRSHARSAWAGRYLKTTKHRIALQVVFWLPNKRRCDLDNLLKLVTDAMNGVTYDDDSQIDSLDIQRAYSTDNPRTEVSLYSLSGGRLEPTEEISAKS